MSQHDDGTQQIVHQSNLIQFPFRPFIKDIEILEESEPATPVYDKLIVEAEKLDALSKYPCKFDYQAYRSIELRYAEKPIRGGPTMKTAFRLVNSHTTCQQCLYSFEIDTYGRGCMHECVYCYAKAELTVHGYWNNPIPVPVDLNEIRKNIT